MFPAESQAAKRTHTFPVASNGIANALHGSLHEPVEDVVHIRPGALADPKSSAHGLGRQVVPFPKVMVELRERNATVALRHIVESFPNRGDLFV